MKLNFTKHFRPSLITAGVFLFMVSSCSKVEDLYKAPEEESSKLINDVKISDSFTWATTSTVDVRIAVDDQFEGKKFYKLEIFDREPSAEGAVLLGAGVAKKGQDLVTQITVPTALSYVYVLTTTPVGQKYYSIMEVNGKNLVGGAKVAAVNKTASVNIKGLTRLASTGSPTVPTVPSGAKVLSGSANAEPVKEGEAYLIESGEFFSGDIPVLNWGIKDIVVYVKGTWNAPNVALSMSSSSKVVVLAGGTLNLKSVNINSGSATIHNFGKANIQDVVVNTKTSFVNVGTLVVSGSMDIPSSGAIFDNYGVANINEMKANSASVITNHKTMVVKSGNFTNPTINVNCHTTFGTLVTKNVTVNVATGGRLDVERFTPAGGDFNFDSEAILDVKKKLTIRELSGSNNVDWVRFTGVGNNKALILLNSAEIGGSNLTKPYLEYSGKLFVAANKSEYDVIGDSTKVVIFSSSTEFQIEDRGYSNPVPVIAGTSCNGGGAGVQPTNPPVDQIPTEIGLGAYSFAFEDNWPYKGDYDMNDLVVDVQVVKYQNVENKVEKVVLKNKIRSVGARYRLAAAIQLDNVLSNNVKSVVYSKPNVVNTSVGVLPLSNGVETGQSKAVVTIVDDVHTAFGQSATGTTQFVFTDGTNVAPFETEITITFNTPIDNFTQDHLNPFIVVNYDKLTSGGKRKEVHLVGHRATDKIISSLITREQEAKGTLSGQDPFKTKSNEPFALSLPLSFKYPKETQNIAELYPELKSWVESNGQFAKDWYNK